MALAPEARLFAESAPEWFEDAIWYQIFPERFRNGDRANDPTPASLAGTWPYEVPASWSVMPWTSDWYALQPWEKAGKLGMNKNMQLRRYGGDLQGIIDKLDYLKQLGVNALYLNPIFESPSLHKYGASMYHHVDRFFGPDPVGDLALFAREDPADPKTWQWTAADKLFLKLVAEAHRRGMHVIIDGVFNHTGIPFWALQRARKEGPTSRFAKWYTIQRWDDPTTPKDEFSYKGWYGIQDLPEFARDEKGLYPDVEEHLHAVVRRWMDPNGDGNPADGIDGWRLDVAAEIPMGFHEHFRSWVKQVNPHAYITGEIWWENFDQCRFRNAKPWLDKAFDGVMNYRFGDAVFQYFNQPEPIAATEFSKLLESMVADYGYSRVLGLQNLFGSHDTARIGSAVVNPKLRQDHGANAQKDGSYLVRKPNSGEIQRWRQMVAFQFLAPGAPYIYYGDEVGMWGADDPDCRKPMLWPDLKYDDEQAHPLGLNRPVDKVAPDLEQFRFYQELVALRKRHAALRRGDFKVLLTENATRIFAFRRNLGGTSVIAVFNASDSDVSVAPESLELKSFKGWSPLLKQGRVEWTGLSIPAHGYRAIAQGN
jgi:glycosidase